MPEVRFDAVLGSEEGGPAFFVEVPAEVVEALGPRKRPAVRATLNGFACQTTVATYGGKFYLPVRREIREAAGLAVGEPIEVKLAIDTERGVVPIPEDLDLALAADPLAREFFERLSAGHRKEYANWIEGAKREVTRRSRVERALALLRAGAKGP